MNQELLIDLSPNFATKLFKYRKMIGIGFFLFCLGLAGLIRFLSTTPKSVGDYLNVESNYAAWANNGAVDQEILTTLNHSMNKHPELAAKIGSAIAQRFLSLTLVQEGSEYVKYLEDKRLPLESEYNSYTKTSLLIAEGQLEEALSETNSLFLQLQEKQAAEEATAYGAQLYAFTLLRLASLSQELKNPDEELKAWKELKRFLGSSHSQMIQKDLERLMNHLTAEKISLYDFISSREALLSSVPV